MLKIIILDIVIHASNIQSRSLKNHYRYGWMYKIYKIAVPARGKSYISKKIYRYLNWLGFNTQVFNIGNFRRKYLKGTVNIDIETNL